VNISLGQAERTEINCCEEEVSLKLLKAKGKGPLDDNIKWLLRGSELIFQKIKQTHAQSPTKTKLSSQPRRKI
jgi:hypothetical protein